MFSDLRYRLRALFDRRAMEQELDDELRAHLERETDKYMREGLSREEATRRARVAFGGIDRIKDDTRDSRGIASLEALTQDLRYAWRGLRTRPGFTTAVVVALGLGIGANAAMFGIVDRLLFRPPAFLRDPDRVHRLFIRYLWNGETRTDQSLAYLQYQEFAKSRAFDLMAVESERRLAVGAGAEAREMPVAAVSATLFDFFDARPVIGRFFAADEDTPPAGATVAVIGYALWQSQFGGRTDVIGKSIHVGSNIYTIVGVAPSGFAGFSEGPAPAVYVPVTQFAYARETEYHLNYNWSWLTVFARRRAGTSLAVAQADLTSLYHRSWIAEAQLSREPARWPTATAARAHAIVAHLLTARGPDAGPDAKVATWVMGVTVIVLLVTCANVANLLLARAIRRRREIALRLALGVPRRRLLQQLLTESVLLAALGGATGLALAQWGGRTLRALFLRGEANAVASDGRTLLFIGLVTMAVALVTGLAPAVAALREDVAARLKTGAREGAYRRSRLRSGLLVFQGALSVVLLIGAGLFVRSLANVRATRLGYDVDPIILVEPQMRGTVLPDDQTAALGRRLLENTMTTPGVKSATFAVSIPFGGNESRGLPFVPGGDTARIRAGQRYLLQAGTEQYFATMGTRIIRGRGFTAADGAGSLPVAVVSQTMAERLWPGEDPIGKQMRVNGPTGPFFTVVGVTEAQYARRFGAGAENWYFVPWEQYLTLLRGPASGLLVRVDGRPDDYVRVLHRRLQQEMPGVAYVNVVPLRTLVAPTQRSWEFGATMFVAFGALALILAAIGLYSVIAYAVAQRTHELGLRMALGASVGKVVAMIVRQGMAFAIAGIVIGGAIALWAGKWLEPLLYAQKARDPLVFAVVAAVLLLVAVVATLHPAWRATRVDPTVALRTD